VAPSEDFVLQESLRRRHRAAPRGPKSPRSTARRAREGKRAVASWYICYQYRGSAPGAASLPRRATGVRMARRSAPVTRQLTVGASGGMRIRFGSGALGPRRRYLLRCFRDAQGVRLRLTRPAATGSGSRRRCGG
jgi:hypothetical protein